MAYTKKNQVLIFTIAFQLEKKRKDMRRGKKAEKKISKVK